MAEAAEKLEDGHGEEIAEKAREIGWRPKDEWDGDDSRWMEPEEFIARNKRLQDKADDISRKEIKRLETELAEMKASVTDLTKMYKTAETRGYKRAQAEIEKKMRKAVEEGDTEAFDEAKKEADELGKEIDTATDNQVPDPNYQVWKSANDWFEEDVDMTAEAYKVAPAISAKLKLKRNELLPKAFYDMLTDHMKKKFPDHFGNANRTKAATVEGGDAVTGGGNKYDYSRWPGDAKDAFKRFVKQGIFTDKKEDRLAYIKDYYGEE